MQLKRNPVLIGIWVLLIVLFSGGIGKIYGVHYLFLDPEYLNRVDFLSFFIVGLSFGCFTMAYHITGYILDGYRFSFVGVLERPFAKFTLNNSILPLFTGLIYLTMIIRFQLLNEMASGFQLVFNLGGFLVGVTAVITGFIYYFRFTNSDIFKYLSGSVDQRLMKVGISRETVMDRLKNRKQNKYRVDTYFDLKLRLRSCHGLNDFYDKKALIKVFDQNHMNSVILELGVIVVILVLGYFMENPIFQIPAAASVLLMMTILVMIVGAISYWLKEWGTAFVFALFLIINIMVKVGVLKGTYEVRGLDYSGQKADYTLENLVSMQDSYQVEKDFFEGIKVLNNWKSRQTELKPKIVFLCVSGGGQRAALWTVNVMQTIDQELEGQLFNKTFMITGASGGMIGAAYYRDILQMEDPARPSPEEQLENIGKDNLNSVIYSLLVNDAFFRVRKTKFSGRTHSKDRGYVFEENLNRNLDYVFREKLSDYKKDELSAQIPLLLLAPVIANDGRKLYLSNLPVAFMNVSPTGKSMSEKVWSVDFNSMYREQGSEGLNFLSALRMSASFPYITPTISLPSEPRMEIMDAGIADNFGVSDAVHFITVFREWIEKNTSGVELIIIRDTQKLAPTEAQSNPSFIDRLTYPIASVYNNLGNMQDINNDMKIEYIKHSLSVPVGVASFEYNTESNIDVKYLIESKAVDRRRLERASLSWHLTTKEKQNIIDNIQSKPNQANLKQVRHFLSQEIE
ncbi:MAG: patatin-like phospholipase family protein [Cyclobacteriaceae bacterium]